MIRPALVLLAPMACAVAVVTAQTPAGDRRADLRSTSIDARLAAIEWVVTSEHEHADLLLSPLLSDRDWEVQQRAARALGVLRIEGTVRPLVDLAVDGKVESVRHAAAIAIAAIAPGDGAAALWSRVRSRTPVPALEALAVVLRGQPGFAQAANLRNLLGHDDPAVREAAAAAWLEAAADRADALTTLLAHPAVAVRCRALDTVSAAPRADDLGPLLELLGDASQTDLVVRRLLRALAATLAADRGDRSAQARTVLAGADAEGLEMTRCAWLLPLLTRGEDPVVDRLTAIAALEPALQSTDVGARAAAAKALREIGGVKALVAALARFPAESEERVLVQLVETVAALRPPTSPDAVRWLTDVAGGTFPTEVRERAIVHLGRSGVLGAVDALAGALSDPSWSIACCAAVSLGKTGDDAALEPLRGLLTHADWRLRGAGVVGLGHLNRAAVIEPVLSMLGDPSPVVAHAAHEALRAMSREYDVKPDAEAWRAWWQRSKDTHQFTNPEASVERLRKYGYEVPDSEIYTGLDVVVIEGANDHIEQLLARLEIDHRLTNGSTSKPLGLEPGGICVVNCAGILGQAEAAEVAWFVRTGGSLFASCWALTHTIGTIHPGVVQMAATRDGVVGEVRAHAALPDSPLLDGVFPPSVVPIYHLFGAHLIEVLDPERCEVLIDSPDAAEQWGCGNLAVWFNSGHGVVFDSANHFDLQGFTHSGRLTTPADRQAYAIDHMGMSFATWRETRTAGYWKRQDQANAQVPDDSAFRLLTNFVRSKRIGAH